MAHFAEINDTGDVLRVIVVHNNELLQDGQESEAKGAQFCADHFGGTWVQTSYSGSFRKNFAGAGMKYDAQRDAFICPCPHTGWVLDEATCQWVPPTPHPNDGGLWWWNDQTGAWVSGAVQE